MIAVGVDVSVRRGLDVVYLDGPRAVACVRPSELADLLLGADAVAIDGPPAFGVPPERTRPAERELRALGIIAYSTPSDPGDNPFYAWMYQAQAAFAAAAGAGFPLYRGTGPVRGTAMEVFPHGSACALAARLPPRGCSRRPRQKREWREAVLRAAGVDTSGLGTLDAVDAALAALTAARALAGDFFTVGDADGTVVLPGPRPAGPYRR